MHSVRTPAWRIAGSFLSWLLFAFSFVGLFQAIGIVIGLGGYCASGGPYVIQTPCPEGVLAFAPLGIFGMLIAAAVSMALADNLGAPLYLWAWPILFAGLGVQFILGAVGGVALVTNLVLGLVCLAMGLVPFWWAVRSAPRPFFLGTTDAAGRPFTTGTTRGRSALTLKQPEGDPVDPTAKDWVLSLALAVLGLGLGPWLAVAAFRALGD